MREGRHRATDKDAGVKEEDRGASVCSERCSELERDATTAEGRGKSEKSRSRVSGVIGLPWQLPRPGSRPQSCRGGRRVRTAPFLARFSFVSFGDILGDICSVLLVARF